MKALITALCIPLLLTTHAATAEEFADCKDLEAYQALDFWVGTWRVVNPEGEIQGHNRIEKILNGCAVLENWTSKNGKQGKSLFYLDPVSGDWKQVWVTEVATQPGGTKEKTLVETFANGGVRFQGRVQYGDQLLHDRTTLTPREDGTVEQHVQVSRDGEEWQPGWQGIYHPVD